MGKNDKSKKCIKTKYLKEIILILFLILIVQTYQSIHQSSFFTTLYFSIEVKPRRRNSNVINVRCAMYHLPTYTY